MLHFFLIRRPQSRLLRRFPSFTISAFRFSRPATSAAAQILNEPTPVTTSAARTTTASTSSDSSPEYAVREVLCGLRCYGPENFLSSNYFQGVILSALNWCEVDRIVDCLVAQDLELAVFFFNFLRNECGFRHSHMSVFALSHVLAEKRWLKELQDVLNQMVTEKGSGSASSLCDLLQNGLWGWNQNRLLWDMLVFCYSRAGMVDDALLVLAKMKDLNLQASICTYNSLLHNLRYNDVVWDVYNEIKANHVAKSEYTDAILIDCLCKQSLIQEAVDFFWGIEGKESRSCIVSFNTLISSFCRVGLLDVAKSYICMMLKYGLFPDVYSYNILIHGLCVAGTMEEALEFAEDMEKHGIEADTVTYNTLAKGFYLLGSMGGAWQVIQGMILKGLTPNLITYTMLICGHCRSNNVEEGIRLLDEMLSRGLQPNILLYSVLLSSLCKSGQLNKALILLEEMKLVGLEPDAIIWSILIRGFCKVGDVQNAIQLYQEMCSRRVLPNSISDGAILLGLCKKGMMSDARMYFDALAKDGLPVNVVLYNIMINGYVKLGNVRDAFELYKEMIEKQVAPSIVTFNSLIYGLCKIKKLAEARKWIDTINIPNTITYTTLMDAYGEEGNISAMLELLQEMEVRSVIPTHITYSVLIKGLCKRRRWLESVKVLEKMYAIGLSPDQVTYNTIMKCLCKASDVRRAFELYSKMVSHNLQPTPVTYNILVSGLCMYPNLKGADELLDSLHRQEADLTKVAYTTLIKAHCVKGDVHRVVLLFHQMLQKGFEISIRDFSSVINRLYKRSFITEAKLFLCMMLYKGILPDQELSGVLHKAFHLDNV